MVKRPCAVPYERSKGLFRRRLEDSRLAIDSCRVPVTGAYHSSSMQKQEDSLPSSFDHGTMKRPCANASSESMDCKGRSANVCDDMGKSLSSRASVRTCVEDNQPVLLWPLRRLGPCGREQKISLFARAVVENIMCLGPHSVCQDWLFVCIWSG